MPRQEILEQIDKYVCPFRITSGKDFRLNDGRNPPFVRLPTRRHRAADCAGKTCGRAFPYRAGCSLPPPDEVAASAGPCRPCTWRRRRPRATGPEYFASDGANCLTEPWTFRFRSSARGAADERKRGRRRTDSRQRISTLSLLWNVLSRKFSKISTAARLSASL